MSKPVDDLEAVRAVIEAVQDFEEDEQQRIFRWAAEKLGLKSPFGVSATPVGTTPAALGPGDGPRLVQQLPSSEQPPR